MAASRDKYLARQRFQAAGLPVSQFFRVPLAADAAETARRASFPCVLKPLGLSGSRGVIRANDVREFIAAFESLASVLGESGFKNVRRYDWRQVEHCGIDDFSQAYVPHMDKSQGQLISLNVEADKPRP